MSCTELGSATSNTPVISKHRSRTLIAALRETCPEAFRSPPVPLALDIEQQIAELIANQWSPTEITGAVRWWSGQTKYLTAVALGAERRNLDGTLAGPSCYEQGLQASHWTNSYPLSLTDRDEQTRRKLMLGYCPRSREHYLFLLCGCAVWLLSAYGLDQILQVITGQPFGRYIDSLWPIVVPYSIGFIVVHQLADRAYPTPRPVRCSF